MKNIKAPFCFGACLVYWWSATVATATVPPRPGTDWPQTSSQFTEASRTVLNTSRAFLPMMRRI